MFRRLTVTAVAAAATTGMAAAPALAANGSIDHVENQDGAVQVLYSLPDAQAAPDLKSLKVSVDGTPLDATAALASSAKGQKVRRTTILTIDVSKSMARNNRFTEAKQAADVFLDSAPKDVYVGIVTFASTVNVAQQPTLDRAASKAVIDNLKLSLQTHLYDGVKQAVTASGTDGQRSLLLLSDGRDTTNTPLTEVTNAVKKAGVKVDAVALGQSAGDEALLQQIADSGKGTVVSTDPKALSQVFANEAETLAKQILVTAKVPATLAGKEGTLSVSIDAGGEPYVRKAFVRLGGASAAAHSPSVAPSTKLAPAPETSLRITRQMMLGGLAAAGVGLLLLLFGLFGGTGKKRDSVESRIEAYTRRGQRKSAGASSPVQGGMAAQAVGFAEKALEGNKGFEAAVGDRLEAAGMSLKPAEWLLLHAGIAVGAAAVAFLLSSGSILFAMVALLAGLLLPWLYLGHKRSSRLKAFNSQLAETLQLLAGSLQAGLSLSQGIDTVVREGADPVAGEFRRVLVEARLGVQLEDALEAVGERMMSEDFKWTVMAIRIQREVGGNLAELLLTVAATLREREYLRRQVKALSAEGRFSAYILLALPPGVLLYMSVVNKQYLHPLISTPIGFVMIGVMIGLMVLGYFTMSKLVKVEV
ncbi:MAG: type II secretion system F family protein [Nocardioidaceae bacterium]